ncbi:hypothetical protein BCR32DRAFT_246245 [Anaeromyces robustus]|uniref:Uncharacterized protein n=1 Tax=Anaeromyces robustus TaxID=1754192 RepID=A0A1Y1X1S5_9FUNG|nr:hypothetical protein BCR32DRAFT_246245 [Anaeromyces robustus]|eukprot:ORX79642.1 hypothetical protein BCR32DRAFT_246245 [Anaeromyces robustus]
MDLYTSFNKVYRNNKHFIETTGSPILKMKNMKIIKRSSSKKKMLITPSKTIKVPKRPPAMPLILKDVKDSVVDNYDRFSMVVNLGFVEKDTGRFYEPIQCGFCEETKKMVSMTDEENMMEKPCNIKYPSIFTLNTLKEHISKCHMDFYEKITNVRINIIQNC